MHKKTVPIINTKTREKQLACIELHPLNNNVVSLKLNWSNLTETAISDNYFDCLKEIRKKIEPLGWMLLCNGARKDVYPSGMIKELSKGLKAYILIAGKPVEKESIVEIFEVADESMVVTVSEQEEYFKKWFFN